MSNLELVALIVKDYDLAICFFVDVLQFELIEDTPSLTNDSRPKRWVVVRPAEGQTGLLLARADGEDHQATSSGSSSPAAWAASSGWMNVRTDDDGECTIRFDASPRRFTFPICL